ncbi:MAG: four helix bundle protein [Dehalococcoidia bacterium]|jgi:four helix bundle protein
MDPKVYANDLRDRTMAFAVSIARFTESLPPSRVSEVFGRQLLRSGSSVGANYRSAQRAQSVAHMISKLAIVEEEADECIYWLELLARAGVVPLDSIAPLIREASQLVAMTVASKKKLRDRLGRPPRRTSDFALRTSSES